jgi:hypothetical protein
MIRSIIKLIWKSQQRKKQYDCERVIFQSQVTWLADRVRDRYIETQKNDLDWSFHQELIRLIAELPTPLKEEVEQQLKLAYF